MLTEMSELFALLSPFNKAGTEALPDVILKSINIPIQDKVVLTEQPKSFILNHIALWIVYIMLNAFIMFCTLRDLMNIHASTN